MKRPPTEWMTKLDVTDRDLDVAYSFVNSARNLAHDEIAEWSLAALIAAERARWRREEVVPPTAEEPTVKTKNGPPIT